MRSLDPALVTAQIANLRATMPELVEDDDAWLLSLESQTDAFEFLRQVELKRREALSMAAALANTIAELGLRQERFERREKAMRGLLEKVMLAADLRKAVIPEATLHFRNGPAAVIITDESLLPPEYIRTKSEPKRDEIKRAIRGGTTVPGALLSNRQPYLDIRKT